MQIALVPATADRVGASRDLAARLAAAGVTAHLGWDGPAGPHDVVVALVAGALDHALRERLEEHAAAGTPVLIVAGQLDEALARTAGVVPGPPTPGHEIRVRPGPGGAGLFARMPGDLVLAGQSFPRITAVRETITVLSAHAGLTPHPVATWSPTARVGLLTVPGMLDDPDGQRVFYRWLRQLAGQTDAPTTRVGLLGYGAIGAEHAAACRAVPGVELTAVCDTNPARVAAARVGSPQLDAFADGDALLACDEVDLVVVSTPPSTHSTWVLAALDAGKHVVVEKPFCLTVAEADRQMAAAADRGRTLAVYQNRRWDRDFLAVRRAVEAGRLGQVFSAEVFVGGYGHPCNYWHSDAEVSGGAFYDWGSHLIDQLLLIMPAEVEYVTAVEHKRVWHDVTNADHSRVTMHFHDGTEATFTHSDLAAALKPKYHLLGTRGALVGDWQERTVTARNAVGLLAEDRLAPADSPATVTLHVPDGSGGTDVTRLATPPPPPEAFHRELSEQLASGWPMSVTPAQARRNVAVMEAASRSSAAGGRPVVPG